MSPDSVKAHVMQQWNAGVAIDRILALLRALGKTFKNGNPLSKKYVKAIIRYLIVKGELKKRPISKKD